MSLSEIVLLEALSNSTLSKMYAEMDLPFSSPYFRRLALFLFSKRLTGNALSIRWIQPSTVARPEDCSEDRVTDRNHFWQCRLMPLELPQLLEHRSIPEDELGLTILDVNAYTGSPSGFQVPRTFWFNLWNDLPSKIGRLRCRMSSIGPCCSSDSCKLRSR